MSDELDFQVSYASKFLESLYETQTYDCHTRLREIYKFDSLWDKIPST